MFFSLRNPEIQDVGPRWPPLENDDVIRTSCVVINPFCARQRKYFSTHYLPTKFHCQSFNAFDFLKGVEGGGGGQNLPPSSPQAQEQKKKRPG